MKKTILFVIDSLHCAGAEKSLITLLSLLDYEKYEVELQLFGYGGALEELLPKQVKLLLPLPYTVFSQLELKEGIKKAVTTRQLRLLSARLNFSREIRKETYSNAQKARIWWQCISKVIEENPKTYDYAISYAQGVPTFYVADKVKAKKKFAWVNVSYRLEEEDYIFQKRYYEQYQKIVTVSHSAKKIFLETFPEFKEKIEIIYDINSPKFIYEMADLNQGYEDGFKGIRILTIGRLAYQKGYEIALESCMKLKQKGIDFRWYALGTGPLKEEIEKDIKEHNLSDSFYLLGVKSNPYPYIKNCDIYVQTSRFEGFGLAIAEARMLNKPVVTTRFDAVYNQMINEKNGLVVDMDSDGVTNGIMRLIKEENLRNNIISYLKTEKKGNEEELEKFYRLLDT